MAEQDAVSGFARIDWGRVVVCVAIMAAVGTAATVIALQPAPIPIPDDSSVGASSNYIWAAIICFVGVYGVGRVLTVPGDRPDEPYADQISEVIEALNINNRVSPSDATQMISAIRDVNQGVRL